MAKKNPPPAMYTFSYFRKMASISPFFLCSSKRLSKWSSLTFGFAWLNFQGPNKPFKHKLKFPSEPWGQTLLIRCNWFSFLHFYANSVEKYIAKFEKYDSFYLFLQISKYQLFFPIRIMIFPMYLIWETSRNKLKKHSVSKIGLTFHWLKNCSRDLKIFTNSRPSAFSLQPPISKYQ